MRHIIQMHNVVISAEYLAKRMNDQLKNNTYGFTLIELIVSIGILVILATFLTVTMNPFEQFLKSQDAKRKSDLIQIQNALESYYQDQGRYPDSTGDPNYYIETTNVTDAVKEWGDNWSPYIVALPEEIGSKQYRYVAGTDGQSYWIYASLARGEKDPQVCNSGDPCENVPLVSGSPILCGTAQEDVCNYGVSSPNVSP